MTFTGQLQQTSTFGLTKTTWNTLTNSNPYTVPTTNSINFFRAIKQ